MLLCVFCHYYSIQLIEFNKVRQLQHEISEQILPFILSFHQVPKLNNLNLSYLTGKLLHLIQQQLDFSFIETMNIESFTVFKNILLIVSFSLKLSSSFSKVSIPHFHQNCHTFIKCCAYSLYSQYHNVIFISQKLLHCVLSVDIAKVSTN